MPSYNTGNNNFKDSNVNYVNKDFRSLKNSLIKYAQSYFPNTYRDFNETSPGMMLMEMTAYVGDVLNFYIDKQYQEMLLPLAEERKNVMNMAKMFGYKVKPIIPAHVNLTFRSEVNAVVGNESQVDYSDAGTFDKGVKVSSTIDNNIIFETLEPIDFTISSSADTNNVRTTNSDTGLIETYTLIRDVKAVSGETKTTTFTLTNPVKFLKLDLVDTNIIDIISVKDTNGNNWYEVDFLAQDKVPMPLHYSENPARDNAYHNLDGTPYVQDVPVPYSLTYIKTSKRFVRETNLDNTTSLVFGNGILKDGTTIDGQFSDLEQVGIIIPGQTNDLNEAIDPLLGDEYSTLGETPSHTILTVTYRVGGGIKTNVAAGDLTVLDSSTVSSVDGGGNTSATLLNVTNNLPARGGSDSESVREIKERTKAFFTTQNRCVTKEDYEARTLNMSSKFGNVSKAYVTRFSVAGTNPYMQGIMDLVTTTQGLIVDGNSNISQWITDANSKYQNEPSNFMNDFPEMLSNLTTHNNGIGSSISAFDSINGEIQASQDMPDTGNIKIYILAYDKYKNLVGNPNASIASTTDDVPLILKQNLQNYIENFRLLSDDVVIEDGYIINFGVFFDVVAHRYANKQEVKIKCIQAIKDYFIIDRMQYSQPLFISQLEYDLMNIDGVRSVNYVRLSQYENVDPITGTSSGESLQSPTYYYSMNNDGTISLTTSGYGYYYDFVSAYQDGVILPPSPQNPGVFELKNPNQNIKGVVR